MTEKNYTPPKLHEKRFHCPHCGTFAAQRWGLLHLSHSSRFSVGGCDLWISSCSYPECEENCLWMDEKMVYPNFGKAPQPNNDLSEEVKKIYGEAALVLPNSPRAAAALLRLALQQLCVQLGAKKGSLLEDIQYLQNKKGLSSEWVNKMDIVRIIGNAAVHPGGINIHDDAEKVNVLFSIINRIAEKLITDPKKDDEFYASLPDSKKIDTIQQEREAKKEKGQSK